MHHRETLARTRGQSSPMGLEGHEDGVGIHHTQATIKALLRKRKPGKASALIPNAALNAAGEVQGMLAMVTWYAELIYVVADTGVLLPQIQIHHKYKGISRDPNAIPLGLADPHLSLISDILYMRTGTMIATYVGIHQQGGQTDPRYMVIMQSDARGIRKQQGLPTVESTQMPGLALTVGGTRKSYCNYGRWVSIHVTGC